MDVAPRSPNRPILDKDMIKSLVVQKCCNWYWYTRCILLEYESLWNRKPILCKNNNFCYIDYNRIIKSFSSRSLTHSVFKIGVFSNKTMNKATLFAFFLLFVVIYVPTLEPMLIPLH